MNKILIISRPDNVAVSLTDIQKGASLEELSEELIQLLVEIASGRRKTCADKLGQDDFIPWKRVLLRKT